MQDTVALVNVDFGPGTLLGMVLIGSGIALYQVRTVRPEIARDFDVFFSSVGLLCGGILVFQGWRLDPLLFFGQLLTATTAMSFAVEAVRLRGIIASQDEAMEAEEEEAFRAARRGRGRRGDAPPAARGLPAADEANTQYERWTSRDAEAFGEYGGSQAWSSFRQGDAEEWAAERAGGYGERRYGASGGYGGSGGRGADEAVRDGPFGGAGDGGAGYRPASRDVLPWEDWEAPPRSGGGDGGAGAGGGGGGGGGGPSTRRRGGDTSAPRVDPNGPFAQGFRDGRTGSGAPDSGRRGEPWDGADGRREWE